MSGKLFAILQTIIELFSLITHHEFPLTCVVHNEDVKNKNRLKLTRNQHHS